jgi:hypothetical protein
LRQARRRKRKGEPGTARWASIEAGVESYLQSVGIGGYQEWNVFWERLAEKHGPIAEEVAQAISAQEEDDDVDVYALKNRTLALSMDVTSQYCHQMYREFLRWFLRERFPEPKSLLDVGCDNGVLTCFYGALYPEAGVVGVDKGKQGIARARELASRLNLANVRFEVCDLLNPAGAFPDQSFDLIVSTTVFHEVLEFPEDLPEHRCCSIDEIQRGSEDLESMKIVAGVVRLLGTQAGVLVSMERCSDAASLAWWIRLLNQAGLRIVADRNTLLKFSDADRELQTLPIVVATRNQHPTVNARDEFLAFRMYGDTAGSKE